MDADHWKSNHEGRGSTCDPVGVYLSELSRCRRLVPHEELSLARMYRKGFQAKERMRVGGRDSRMLRLAHQGEEAGRKLVESHLPLVVHAARAMYAKNRHHVAFEDLICAGNLGLLEALARFDPSRGYRFSTYAMPWVRNKMAGQTRHERWPIRIPDHMYKKVLSLLKLARCYSEQHCCPPTTEQLATAARRSVSEVRSILVWARQDVVSLDVAVGENGGSTLGDSLADDRLRLPEHDMVREGAEAAVEEALHDHIQWAVSALPPRERRVVDLRFGLEDGQSRTLEEVARHLHVTAERVRQLEAKALRRMRHPRISRSLIAYLE